ncbi:hypothetical protein NQ317_002970 [Molorchus minor]|uniref:Uncharacterized protein n=1 Tax=Molorchus minor TaxID=1323400 RepID=A0ABQ9J762_9CUCU|nr:hypothetical protein NQ317_002970 [Molorchus minor]
MCQGEKCISKKVSTILQKLEIERTVEEARVLSECPDEVEEVQERWRKRDEAKRRLAEFEDPEDVLTDKCQMLAQAIAQSQHLVVYAGTGISTAKKYLITVEPTGYGPDCNREKI